MKPNQTNHPSPHLLFFSDDQLHELHLKTLEVLERVGVAVDEEEALQLLGDGGAFVDGNRVRIPSWMVEEAIRTAPPRIVLANREGDRSVILEKNQVNYGLGSDMPYTLDPFTGERRASLKQDVVNAAMVVDVLEHIDFIMSMAIATDTPEKTSDLHQFQAMVVNSKKPIVFTAHHRQALLDIIEMATVICGDKKRLQRLPFLACYSEPISPLRHAPEGTQKLLTCAEHRIPIIYTPGLMSGATGPVTLAGALITANAELLSGLVIHQLKEKGAPFIYGGVATVMDMQTTIFSYGSPDFHLNNLVLTQLSQKYQLPVFSTGGCTDSPILDNQASIEATYSLLLTGLIGANLIHDVGYLEAGLTQSLASIVICDETISIVKRLIKGYAVNEETLAMDVIEEVGPGGEFLTHPHTLKHFSQEHWRPKLICRNRYDEWAAKGKKSMQDRANEVVQKIIQGESNSLLKPDIQQELQQIIAKAEARTNTK